MPFVSGDSSELASALGQINGIGIWDPKKSHPDPKSGLKWLKVVVRSQVFELLLWVFHFEFDLKETYLIKKSRD